MSQLQLILINNSKNPGNLVVFQQDGNQMTSDPLAWFSKYVYPSTQVSFSWDPQDLDFVWSGTGQIKSGMLFDASQVVPANLTKSNQITLSYDLTNHVFLFKDQTAGEPSGTLIINQDGSLPANAAAVGIGVAGRAILAVQAMPATQLQVMYRPTYWVTFGTVQQGEFFTIESTLTPI